MSLWGNLDAANNAPKQGDTSGYGGFTTAVSANTQKYYANTQIDGFINDATVGVFGLSALEASNTGAGKANTASAHAGWVMRKEGTGGRAGRIQTETLVAMGSMTGDHAAANTTYPGV